jgi:hypothetical protein
VTLQSNLTKTGEPTNQRIGAPGVGEVVRRAAKAAWLATKAFPKAEKRVGIMICLMKVKVPDKNHADRYCLQIGCHWHTDRRVHGTFWDCSYKSGSRGNNKHTSPAALRPMLVEDASSWRLHYRCGCLPG